VVRNEEARLLIDRPIYRSSYHVEIVEPEGVFLLSEHGHSVLKGELHCRLAPLLDGRHTTDEIVDELADQAPLPDLYYAIELLEQKGYIVEADGAIPPSRAAFWHALGRDAAEAESRLREVGVSVLAIGDVTVDACSAALAELGLSVVDDGDQTVVLTDDYLQEGLAELNAEAVRSSRPWLLTKPVGTKLWVGPLFRPPDTACWDCLAHRLRGNRDVDKYLQAKAARSTPFPISQAALPATVRAAAELAALALARAVVEEAADEADLSLVTVDLVGFETAKHHVVRRPQCPVCGDGSYAPDREPVPLVLESRHKEFTADGGHRSLTPEQTIAQYEHLVSPISGAVNHLVRAHVADDSALPVYLAGHNLAMRADSLHFLRQGIRSKSGGKGMSDVQAKASALCEALERFSGNFQGDEIRRRASYVQLGERAIHPDAFALFSARQYRERDQWNARGSKFERVPEPFDEEAEVDWTPVWSLSVQEFRYVPTGYCYYGYPSAPNGSLLYLADSNGNAAGNTREEAILQGFMELVERDGVALWWYNRVRRPAVDLLSFGDSRIAELVREYDKLGRELWVLDVTSDLQIPTFAAISRNIGEPGERILVGFGAHFDPSIGLLRALTEMNQSLVVVRGFEHGPDEYDPPLRSWWQTATVANQPYLVPAELPPTTASDYDRTWSDDVREDVLRCQEIVEAKGMEMLVLDQTRPDIGLPVVKVFVPGIRHFWARFAPGRLYDVPVELGWLERPLAEDELNPVGMFV
jgi:ribosomal protein S12 methylthiotransferase accessory factor